ncbi:lipoprotein LpqH [Mycobacterium sp. NPDC003449]
MNHRLFAPCVALLAGIVGCSSGCSSAQGHTPPDQPPQGRVNFGTNDAGPVTSIGCRAEDGRITITIEGRLPTTVVLTDSEAPAVKSVSIGRAGTGEPALAYIDGTSTAPVLASRDGKNYTVTGSGLGTDAANPLTPVQMPFDVAVTCP